MRNANASGARVVAGAGNVKVIRTVPHPFPPTALRIPRIGDANLSKEANTEPTRMRPNEFLMAPSRAQAPTRQGHDLGNFNDTLKISNTFSSDPSLSCPSTQHLCFSIFLPNNTTHTSPPTKFPSSPSVNSAAQHLQARDDGIPFRDHSRFPSPPSQGVNTTA